MNNVQRYVVRQNNHLVEDRYGNCFFFSLRKGSK